MGAKSLSTQNIEHGQTRCTRDVVSCKRASVRPGQPCRHLLRGDHCPKRQTAADGLREADNIWLHPKLLGSEKRARPIAACLHFVYDEQNPKLITERADLPQKGLRRDDISPFPLNRFNE